jgi:hypothetical protein
VLLLRDIGETFLAVIGVPRLLMAMLLMRLVILVMRAAIPVNRRGIAHYDA